MLLPGTREAEPWQSTGRPRWKRDRLQRGDHSQHRETLERNQVFGWPGQHDTFKATREKSSKSPGPRSWHRSRHKSWARLSAQGTKMDFHCCSWNPSAVRASLGRTEKPREGPWVRTGSYTRALRAARSQPHRCTHKAGAGQGAEPTKYRSKAARRERKDHFQGHGGFCSQ